MHLLLTNDDGYTSQLFKLLVNFLKPKFKLTIVAPKVEQSWTGKSMTRWKDLTMEKAFIDDTEIYLIDGTPADCINIAISHLCSEPPDLVVSGINIGSNLGIGFILSSATVGAAIEANISGIPSFSLSQVLPNNIYSYYSKNHCLPEDTIANLTAQAEPFLEQIFSSFLNQLISEKRNVTWNFNLPTETAPDCQIKRVPIANSVYGVCHNREGDLFKRKIVDRINKDSRETDVSCTSSGNVSFSEIDLFSLTNFR